MDRETIGGRDDDIGGYLLALRQASGRVPEDQVDWEALRSRLMASAEVRLARLRRAREVAWWEVTAGWSRTAVPVAIAAGIALVALIRSSPREGGRRDTAVVASASTTDTGRSGRARAAFESAVVGSVQARGDDPMLLPTASEMLIPSLATRVR